MELTPFDPAEYLDNEESIAAFLADAWIDGPEAIADAKAVIQRARQMHQMLPEPVRKVG